MIVALDQDSAEVVAALRRAADRVDMPPEFTTRARHRGEVTLRRRRLVAAGVAVVAVLAGTVTVQQALAQPRTPSADRTGGNINKELMTAATRGDLATDSGYLSKVVTAWNTNHILSEPVLSRTMIQNLRGKPHVVWAGQTPAGAAAIVAQEAVKPSIPHHRGTTCSPGPKVQCRSQSSPGRKPSSGAATPTGVMLGFIGPDGNGQPALIAATFNEPPHHPVYGVFVGANRSVLVVLDHGGQPLRYSTGRSYHPDGKVVRTFQPLPVHDGVAVLPLPAGIGHSAVVVARAPFRYPVNEVSLANAREPQVHPAQDTRMPWRSIWQLPSAPAAEAAWGGPLTENVGSGVYLAHALKSAWVGSISGPNDDPFAMSRAESSWYVCGVTPDGHRFVLGERQLGDDPSYLYGNYLDRKGRSTVLFGGQANANQPLPVHIRLPNQQGWVVAAEGTALRYLAGDGWHDAGQNAALLPAAATKVEVTAPGKAPVTVTLPA